MAMRKKKRSRAQRLIEIGKLPAGGLERAFWDAVGLYGGKGYGPKKAEKLAWRDLRLEYPLLVRKSKTKRRRG